ncbi:MAG: hypothetical protein ACRBK7_16610 [Acidimicrobiales bacterium]
MSVEPSELLERLSATLRHEVGPEVGNEYAKTQTFMASVILGKLAKQLSTSDAHREGEQNDLRDLHQKLAAPLTGAPDEVVAAAAEAKQMSTVASLSPVIEAIYRWGPDEPKAAVALGLIRATLRGDIDRRMEIAT